MGLVELEQRHVSRSFSKTAYLCRYLKFVKIYDKKFILSSSLFKKIFYKKWFAILLIYLTF
ncbi:hypothetical protein B5J93_02840 [Moraxella equi]|uniref:Uncharacterized protein n=1 Tax=Moraxella equi TaxID=60442 RepID=A0ABX3NJQ6_9GAMM|nr:hypothetical protein B5J93_02840 [Moraxella equi]